MTNIAVSRLVQIIDRFSNYSLLVVGDLMVDAYLYGKVNRISPEGPVMVMEVDYEDWKPGGSANVAGNIKALGARVHIAGLVGADPHGENLSQSLKDAGIGVAGVITDSSRPTTRKTRIVAQNQQVLRIDREVKSPASEIIGNDLFESISHTLQDVDAILVSDYQKGAISERIARKLVPLGKSSSKPVMANLKPESCMWLEGADVVTLNQSEAEQLRLALSLNDKDMQNWGAAMRSILNISLLVITLGSKGLAFWTETDHQTVRSHAVEVSDVAGAGDSFVSALTMALLAGASPLEAATIANIAGACAVRKHGVVTVAREELLIHIHDI